MRNKILSLFVHRMHKRMQHRRKFKTRMRLMAQHYKKICNNYLLIVCKGVTIYRQPLRKIWRKKRNTGFWANALNHFDDAQWVETFRMPKRFFFDLCEELKPELSPKLNAISPLEPASAAKKLAVALYKLASCSEYRVIGDVFGIHKSTVHSYFYEVICLINKKLLSKMICMPNEEECKEISEQFERKSLLPQIIGCIDGTHIPIMAPENGRRDFINRKGWASLNLQAVVDHNLLFRNISCKYPGSCHDALAFKGSSLYKYIKDFVTKNICGEEIPYVIVGDPAYPLMTWLLKDYSGIGIPTQQEAFNKALNSCRVSVEIAFGRLKARWRMLSKRSDINHFFMPSVVVAGCILHNFIEEGNGGFTIHWIDELENDPEMALYEQPFRHLGVYDSLTGREIRDILSEYLSQVL